jgi:hypothetical protein
MSYAFSTRTPCILSRLAGMVWKPLTYVWKTFSSLTWEMTATGLTPLPRGPCEHLPYALSSYTRCLSIELAGIVRKFLTYLATIFCVLSCRTAAAGASLAMIFTAAS